MNKSITSVTYCTNIALVTLPEIHSDSGILAEILTAIAEGGVNIDMISQTAPRGGEISVAFSVSESSVTTLLPIINSLKSSYHGLKCEISSGMGKLTFFDNSMVNTPGVAARVLSMISKSGAQIMTITTATVDISVLVSEHDLYELLPVIENEFGVKPLEVDFE